MEDYYQVHIHPQARIAPNATIIGNVSIEKDATVLFNATLRSEHGGRIIVGEGSNIQENCCVHLQSGQTCTVGRGVTVGHGAILHGCTIGDNTLVGMGSIVMDGAVVGKNCLVAAGALVTGNTVVPDNTLVMGAPARPRRTLTPEEIARNQSDAEEYLQVGDDLIKNGIIYSGENLPTNIMTIAIG